MSTSALRAHALPQVHTSFPTSAWLHGIIADLPTPFDRHGALDLLTFARLCERQVCAGASAIVVGESAGEADTLTPEERAVLIRTAVSIARGRIHIIAGAGSNCTSRAIAAIRLAQAAGADAVMSVVPYYNRPTADGIAAHFRTILETTSLPVIVHDAPSRCARALTDRTLLDLATSPRLIGLRDDTGDAGRLARLRPLLPAGFRILTGQDIAALSYLLLGGDGVVSAMANVAPQLCRGMYYAARQGCPRYATTISDMLAPLAGTLPPEQASAAVKFALSLRGLGNAAVRLPLTELTETEQQQIYTAMEAIWAQPDDALPLRRAR
ncbi:4-hydroxy-tetrahydrodipicolinate synthase [Bradyrhizobium sp. NFR13]|uniref:4-hydroxy-tetrahydrodipicolinate synthase n=1 Tax=Bradyrhizobium sp. NFR13 TaxID=1566285 RepID=UPI0008E2B21D|nr:4-hydroxy-tetrahydrodipicolinate synthase [Bradyrhizobium sp. NFR13]SFM17399.1 4-hydroxy-tetrahydrodipicolinate synthase [Bradyrhizobium sp. NFR13]